MTADQARLEAVWRIARDAAKAIMTLYRNEIAVTLKADQSPVTQADLLANRRIVAALERLDPATPILSEESVERFSGPGPDATYYLVDPLDGTKEFIKRNDEFTVNIALICQGAPVLGVVVAPALDESYLAARGLGAFKVKGESDWRPIRTRAPGTEGFHVLGSRSHRDARLDDWLRALGPHRVTPMGSSLKACRIAEGAADVYPRFGPTSLWDTAAAQAVVEAAGGCMIDAQGHPLSYAAPRQVQNPSFFVWGRRP
ncbi:3'(2'),5'-bisphosphate nucleotidase CysQ [Vreelandella malpeensis]|uniref:3'(2'),5'-bisphosphate nucleotidase CysQ n=1 Tax=Vreelandella malpeensis TaxID=1172368 RepID=A0ABS8DVU9_9GAMM|nr:3'(2'),5'-bisphosphate nucleotidase CysQ [Halomonas malpeensis]MCB8890454.1 3'(2'),5'-bisphosphate nucleotidase CysQ [Halomonas malpeensis]